MTRVLWEGAARVAEDVAYPADERHRRSAPSVAPDGDPRHHADVV
jgi:hypothetical protein